MFIVKDTKSTYKDFLTRIYCRSPLAHEEKLFFDYEKWRRYIELAIIEKDDETSTTAAVNIFRGKNMAKEILTPIVTLNDILKPGKDGESVQLVLIEGESGIGKTTVAQQLCHKWAKEELDSVKEYDLIVLVPLRKRRAQTAEEAEHLLLCDRSLDMKDVMTKIGRGERVLIVCDGFDELPSEQLKESSVYVRLFNGELLPKATVIVTTRPSASDVFKRVCKQRIDRKLEIIGFTEAGITEFAESIFSDDDLNGFLSYLADNPSIYNLMYLPLSAIIVAKIYQEDYKTRKKPLSQLFDAFTRVLIRKHILSKHRKEVYSITFPLTSLKNIDKLPHAMAPHFHKIAKMAYDGICANENVFINPEPRPGEKLENLELMREVKCHNVHGHYFTYFFFHHSLQEYMAAIHIATMLSGKLASLRLQFKEKHMITRFLAGICHANQYEHSHDLLKWLVKFLGGNCFDRSGAQQLIHCGFECPSIMERLEVPYSEENPFIVVEPELGTDWYAMGYCISHFDERWGLHVTSLKEENVNLLFKGLSSANVQGRIQHLHISKSDLPIYQVLASFRKGLQLRSLELQYVNVNEEDVAVLRQLIAPETGLKSLSVRTVNDYTHTSSFIPILLDDSSLEELVVRTGSKANIDTELLPHTNTNLKKLTISCELVQPLKTLLPNTSLTHLVVNSLVYDSDLPIFTSLIQCHSTLQVLELGLVVNYTSTPKPTYVPLESASDNLNQLARVSASCCQLKKLKLHEVDYKYNLPKQFQENSTIVCC